MNWKIEVKPSAENQYRKFEKDTRKRIKKSLIELEKMENPLTARTIRALTGELRGDFRLRVGKWRVLFTPDKGKKILYVYAIIPRGDAY
jgi:mRNA interferase RelE/StbE